MGGLGTVFGKMKQSNYSAEPKGGVPHTDSLERHCRPMRSAINRIAGLLTNS